MRPQKDIIRFLVPGFLLLAVNIQAGVSTPHFVLSLEEAESRALAYSSVLKAAESEMKAAAEKADSQFGTLVPRLSLDGNYRYVTEVPTFQPSPASPKVPFGDHKNYSYGPLLSWNAFSSGQNHYRWKSAQSVARAQKNHFDAVQRQIRLDTRIAYFQIQLVLEQVFLLSDSLKLAQGQYKDIDLRRKAGASSRIDSLSAHQEVFNRSRELRLAQTELAGFLRSLFSLTGIGSDIDPSIPMDFRMAGSLPADVDFPTTFVQLDPIVNSEKKMEWAARTELDVDHPSILTLSESIEAARRTARALRGEYGPALSLLAKISRDYPKGPVLETITQKTFSAAASLPLFQGGRILHDARAQDNRVEALKNERDQALLDLERSWNHAQDKMKGLRAQGLINEKSVSEAETLARLVYDAYKAGGATYLDVEKANLRVLQTKVIHANTRVENLMQLAILDSLSKQRR